jgi:hypothetical protein
MAEFTCEKCSLVVEEIKREELKVDGCRLTVEGKRPREIVI